MERSNITATGRLNVGLVSGLEFGDLDFVRRLVRGIDTERFNLVLTADVVACRVAETEAETQKLSFKWLKWKCRPWKLVPFCPNMVLLYDGGNFQPLSDLVTFARRYQPKTRFAVFGPDGPLPNGVDFLDRARATVQLEKRGYGDYGGPTSPAHRVTRGIGTEIRDTGAGRRLEPRGVPCEAVV